MPNANYLKGRRKEYKIMHELKDNGFEIAHRTAGSHSPIDVFGISRDKRIIKFIQSKPDNYGKTASKRIHDALDYLNGVWNVEFELI